MDQQIEDLQISIVDLMKNTNCNCAEAIIKVMAERFGFDPAMSRFGTVFGGGVSRNADLCGYLTGGLLVISLRFGRVDCSDKLKKKKCYEVGAEFYDWFMKNHGRCCDIKGDPAKGPYDDCYVVGKESVPKLIEIIEGHRSQV